MLQRSLRLPSHTRFQQFHLYRTPVFTVKIAKNNLSYSRFGFIISKKTAKSSVDRNSSRRKVRSGVERLLKDILPGYDFLFVITKNLVDESTVQLQEAVENLLMEKGYLNKK
jgi:ribonuclease P protein component